MRALDADQVQSLEVRRMLKQLHEISVSDKVIVLILEGYLELSQGRESGLLLAEIATIEVKDP
jgi:hypothetical protein